ANVVADALSRKSLHMSSLMARELELIEEFRNLSLVCERTTRSVKVGMSRLTNDFLEEVVEKQKTDTRLIKYKALIEQGKKLDIEIDDHGVMRC
ncbi:polynucleotidyl transferase ribonuclease H fold, partial [Trifolium medium]|nr:polynucleotidyl transferase ribonuclease H fold [Trifolium medium]